MRHVESIAAPSPAALRRQQEHEHEWAQLQQKRGTNEEEFNRVAALIERAHNLPEIRLAAEELRAWVRDHPEDRERLADVFHLLLMLEDGAREAQAETEAMRLSEGEIRQRENLTLLCRDVRAEATPEKFRPALREARRALETWGVCHAEDPLIPELSAYLAGQEKVADLLHETV
jgi:hypothetical protein